METLYLEADRYLGSEDYTEVTCHSDLREESRPLLQTEISCFMNAERLILETDSEGNLKQLPQLPPNKQFEAIFLVIGDIAEVSATRPPTSRAKRRTPHPDIAGKLGVFGDII